MITIRGGLQDATVVAGLCARKDISLNKMAAKIPRDFEMSHIGQFYAGKTVFITGATGFMGKVRLY